jgi:ubiquinone/menaquinone biosynthesis C-methylase UbiE
MADGREHQQRIRDAFTRQARTMEDPRLNQAFTSGISWLLEIAEPRCDDTCLDVAAGTGLVAREFAARASRVVALDATPAMVAEARQQAERAGVVNVDFVFGDAAWLPLRSGAFSLVVSRFSLHHFADPAGPLREMVRVCQPGGRLLIQDLAASTDPETAMRQDHLERVRDPSHLRMTPEGVLRRWLEEAGARVTRVETRTVQRPVGQWLRQALTGTEATAEVLDRLEGELAGGEVTGLRPSRRDGELWFTQTWEAALAVRS